jgi:hypothetical protein
MVGIFVGRGNGQRGMATPEAILLAAKQKAAFKSFFEERGKWRSGRLLRYN